MYQGQYFGEVSTLFGIPTTAEVRAASTLKVFSVPSQNFRGLLKSFHLTRSNVDVETLLSSMVNRVGSFTFTTKADSKIKQAMKAVKEGGPVQVLLLQDQRK